jgi:hypothetical protein
MEERRSMMVVSEMHYRGLRLAKHYHIITTGREEVKRNALSRIWMIYRMEVLGRLAMPAQG